jgi:hypothetical protein
MLADALHRKMSAYATGAMDHSWSTHEFVYVINPSSHAWRIMSVKSVVDTATASPLSNVAKLPLHASWANATLRARMASITGREFGTTGKKFPPVV